MADEAKSAENIEEGDVSYLQSIINEIIGSPINLILVAIITYLIFKIFQSRKPTPAPPAEP
jgi:membrane-associated progesterone receptor component